LSGPTWRRELPPFVEDKAPLMIALAVSSSMGRTLWRLRAWARQAKSGILLNARAGAEGLVFLPAPRIW
jgi:Ca-activated chloride channel family protein